MAKTQPVLQLGSGFLCVESDREAHPESVSIALRERTAKGRPGRRIAVDFYVKRHGVLRFALQLLELGERMMAETDSSVARQLPALAPRDALARLDLLEPCERDQLLDRGRGAAMRYGNLRRRTAMLHLAQEVLESCDDATAATLEMLLVCVKHTGQLPVTLTVDVSAPEQEVKQDVEQGDKP